MRRYKLIFENRWKVFKLWMLVHPIFSLQMFGVTIVSVSVGNFVQIEILNFCMTIHS